MQKAVDDASGVSGVVEAVTAVSAAISALGVQFSSTFTELEQLDAGGELEAAFKEADSCDELSGVRGARPRRSRGTSRSRRGARRRRRSRPRASPSAGAGSRAWCSCRRRTARRRTARRRARSSSRWMLSRTCAASTSAAVEPSASAVAASWYSGMAKGVGGASVVSSGRVATQASNAGRTPGGTGSGRRSRARGRRAYASHPRMNVATSTWVWACARPGACGADPERWSAARRLPARRSSASPGSCSTTSRLRPRQQHRDHELLPVRSSAAGSCAGSPCSSQGAARHPAAVVPGLDEAKGPLHRGRLQAADPVVGRSVEEETSST